MLIFLDLKVFDLWLGNKRHANNEKVEHVNDDSHICENYISPKIEQDNLFTVVGKNLRMQQD